MNIEIIYWWTLDILPFLCFRTNTTVVKYYRPSRLDFPIGNSVNSSNQFSDWHCSKGQLAQIRVEFEVALKSLNFYFTIKLWLVFCEQSELWRVKSVRKLTDLMKIEYLRSVDNATFFFLLFYVKIGKTFLPIWQILREMQTKQTLLKLHFFPVNVQDHWVP